MQFPTENNKKKIRTDSMSYPLQRKKIPIIAVNIKAVVIVLYVRIFLVIKAPIKIPIGDAAKTTLYQCEERFISLTTITCSESIYMPLQVN